MKNILLIVAICFSQNIWAQQESATTRGTIGIGLHLACPQSELKDIEYDGGIGLNLSYLTNTFPKNSDINFQLGARMDFANLRSKTFSDIELDDPGIIGDGSLKVGNRMYGLLALGRLNFAGANQRVTPYIDFLAGHRNYSTYSVLSLNEPENNLDYEAQDFTNRVVHTSRFHYGAGLGLTYKINRSLAFECGATYTIGGVGAALPLKDVEQYTGSDEVNYNRYKSVRTDILLINAGIRITINRRESSGYRPAPTRNPTPTPNESRTDPEPDNTNDTPVIKDRNSTPIPAQKKPIKIKPKGPIRKPNNS